MELLIIGVVFFVFCCAMIKLVATTVLKKKFELRQPIDIDLEIKRWQKALNDKYGKFAPMVYKNNNKV